MYANLTNTAIHYSGMTSWCKLPKQAKVWDRESAVQCSGCSGCHTALQFTVVLHWDCTQTGSGLPCRTPNLYGTPD